ncbi:MAG TPA: copper resistance CopC family protein [Gemmatimonadales bacterium]
MQEIAVLETLRRGAAPLALAAIIGWPSAAPFHLALKSSTPGKDAAVQAAPKEIRLTFTAKPEVALSDIRVSSAAGKAVETGKVAATADSLTVAAPVVGPMPEGAYVVSWRTAGKDGHVIRGKFGFTVSAGSAVSASARPCATAGEGEEHAH